MLGLKELICIWYNSIKLMLGLIESLLKIKEEIEEECWWDVFTEEILPRLPAKQLQTLKTVCKNWNRIISSPYFVWLHLNVFNQRRIRLLMLKNSGATIEYVNYCDKETKFEEIRHPPAFSGRKPVILGSCDGLLCLLLMPSDTQTQHSWFAIYNPSTGKCFIAKKCPDLDKEYYFYYFCSWFGYHPSCEEEYVLVLGLALQKSSTIYKVGVYKFSPCGSELKPIHSETCFFHGPDADYHERGVLLHGAIHWPAEWISLRPSPSSTVISAYHLDSNKHYEISTPPVRYIFSKLGVARGCLFVIFKPGAACVPEILKDDGVQFEMWIMNEYGVQQSWTKYAYIQGFNTNIVLSPLGFFPNGDLILDVYNRKVIRYSFNDNKAVMLMNHLHSNLYGEAIMCADSLVFPAILLRRISRIAYVFNLLFFGESKNSC